MEYYVYDGTLEGVFTGVYDLFKLKKDPDRVALVSCLPEQMALLETIITVPSSKEKATSVLSWIEEAFDEASMERILTAFLADDAKYGSILYRALKVAHRLKHREALTYFKDPDIMNLYALYRKVVRLQHLMLGIIRFQELKSGVYYAYFEPDYNILPLLTDHFKERLGDQLWVIHDGLRHQAAFYDGKAVFINPVEAGLSFDFSDQEARFQELWQSYFKHIAIKERQNPRCQRSFLPQKYWKFLVEDPQKRRQNAKI